MRLLTLSEDQGAYKIDGARTLPDRKKIQKLDKALYGRQGFRPKIIHTAIMAVDRGQVVGYVVLKPNSTTLYWLRSGIHPDYEDSNLARELWAYIQNIMPPLGFKEITARTSDENKSALFSKILGEPVGNIQFKHKKVDKFRACLEKQEEMPATEQRAQKRTASRAGARYSS